MSTSQYKSNAYVFNKLTDNLSVMQKLNNNNAWAFELMCLMEDKYEEEYDFRVEKMYTNQCTALRRAS